MTNRLSSKPDLSNESRAFPLGNTGMCPENLTEAIHQSPSRKGGGDDSFSLFSDQTDRSSSSFSSQTGIRYFTELGAIPLVCLGEAEKFTPLTQSRFGLLVHVVKEYDFGVIDRILTQFPGSDLGIQLRILLNEMNRLAEVHIPKQASSIFNNLIFEQEIYEFRSALNYAQGGFLVENPEFGFFPSSDYGVDLLNHAKGMIERLRNIHEVVEWIGREEAAFFELTKGPYIPVASHVLEKAREANRVFRAAQPPLVPPEMTGSAGLPPLSEEELLRVAALGAEDYLPEAGWVVDGKYVRTPFTVHPNLPPEEVIPSKPLDLLLEMFFNRLAYDGNPIGSDFARSGLFGIVTREGGTPVFSRLFDVDTLGLTPEQAVRLFDYLSEMSPTTREVYLQSYRTQGIERILFDLEKFDRATKGEVIYSATESTPGLKVRSPLDPVREAKRVPVSPEKFSELARKFPQYDFEKLAEEAVFNPAKLQYFEDLIARLSSLELTPDKLQQLMGSELSLKLDPEELAKLVQSNTLSYRSSSLSFGTYLGLGLNAFGFFSGIFLTPYSAYVTVKDLDDPKVDKLETAYDAGITTITGVGTAMAGASLAVTLMVYKLTGTVVLASGPIGWGVGLIVLGGALAYAKEGKVEDRGARDLHGILIQNISLQEKAEALAILAEEGDDEMVNKTFDRLKRWNPELLNPNNPEAQALWRNKIQGKKGEKPFAEEMRNTAKGYWIGSDDDAVSLVVLAQLMGNQEDLVYALSKVDPQSYENFRAGIAGLKSFEDLKKNRLNSSQPTSPSPQKIKSPQLVCESEIESSSQS